MEVTPQIQTIADKIAKGASGHRAQAQKLYEWVSSHIRYVGVELGAGAMIPHAAQTVLTNGYGDCKDHVTLLGALLKAEGIDSEAVLIDSTNDYSLTKAPSFIGLDHVITYIPELKLFLDSTAVVAPFGVLPFQEYGKPVAFAPLKNSRQGMVPVLPPGVANMTTTTIVEARQERQAHWHNHNFGNGTILHSPAPYRIGH